MHLRALVRAVLAPHDRIHRELAGRRAAAEDLPDPGVLVVLEAELCVRLLDVRRRLGVLHGVHGHARVLTRCVTRAGRFTSRKVAAEALGRAPSDVSEGEAVMRWPPSTSGRT